MTNSTTPAQWTKYLRADPTRWMLETGDPSILLWYQLDIAHRPEDARVVLETRERVLYSDPVQAIFAAQDEIGFWGDAENLAQPYYHATLWNLALLAELGIPRTSRRARNACAFVLQNFLNADGTFAGLNAVESGYLIHALAYFNLAEDARLVNAARTVLHQAAQANATDGARITALWAIQEIPADKRNAHERARVMRALDSDSNPRPFPPLAFPQFDPSDPLFILRVLMQTESSGSPRLAPLIEHIVSKQNENAQWMPERAFHHPLGTLLEKENASSRWITLNALRVITRLVLNEKKRTSDSVNR